MIKKYLVLLISMALVAVASFADESELIFGDESQDVFAKFLDFGGETVFISFNAALPEGSGKRPLAEPGAGYAFFRKNKISTIFISNRINNWYQTLDMLSLLDAVKLRIKKFKTVITYGGSMGGWAALAFSKPLNATSVLVFGPQVVLNKWPYYKSIAHSLGFDTIFTVEEGLSPSANVYVFYAQNHEHDRNAIESDLRSLAVRINLKNFHAYRLPLTNHAIMRDLQQTQLLGQINLAVMRNDSELLDSLFSVSSENLNLLEQNEYLTRFSTYVAALIETPGDMATRDKISKMLKIPEFKMPNKVVLETFSALTTPDERVTNPKDVQTEMRAFYLAKELYDRYMNVIVDDGSHRNAVAVLDPDHKNFNDILRTFLKDPNNLRVRDALSSFTVRNTKYRWPEKVVREAFAVMTAPDDSVTGKKDVEMNMRAFYLAKIFYNKFKDVIVSDPLPSYATTRAIHVLDSDS